MADFLNLLRSIFDGLLNLLNDSHIKSVLGSNLFHLLIAFFIGWMMFRIFVARDDYSPGRSLIGSFFSSVPNAVSVKHSKHDRQLQLNSPDSNEVDNV